MSSYKTKTATNTSVSTSDAGVVVKTITTTTKEEPGKEPEVKVEEKVEKFDSWDKLPEDLRKALEKQDKIDPSKINKKATKGDFAEEALKIHNEHRKKHGVESLKLSKELVKHSKERAKELAEKDELKPNDSEYGENITCLSSNNPEFAVTAEEVCERWYQESDGYNYKEEPKTLEAGHFTQMVWKDTKEFGIAAVKSDTNKVYIVASYKPCGNYVNKFIQNVHPKKDSSGGIKDSVTKLSGGKKEKKERKDSSSSNEDDSKLDQLNKECVKVHNEYRKKHGVPAMKYSKELHKYAQEWADRLAKTEKLEHRSQGKYGENLYYSYSSNLEHLPSARDACESWYSEISDHTFGREPNSTKTGHFTQMVWKQSTEVGMGRANTKSGKHYIVANYSPPGNFIGKYTENVLKPH